MTNNDMDSVIPYFNGLPHESLEEYRYDVETYIHGTKQDDRKLCGPRLLRKLGGVPGALAGREITPEVLAKEDGYKLIFAFLEKHGYKKPSLDRKILAQKRYEAIQRRPHQSLLDYFAVENMAFADATRDGLKIDDDRRAYNMLLKSGLTQDQINHIYAYVHDPDATDLAPGKIQDAILKFYDTPFDVNKHRDSRSTAPRFARPLVGVEGQQSYQKAGTRGTRQQGREAPTHVQESWTNPDEWNDIMFGYSAETWYEEDEEDDGDEFYGDIDTYWAGHDDWIHRDMLDEEVSEQLLEEECQNDEQLASLFVNYKEARDQLNQARRGRGFWPVVARQRALGTACSCSTRAGKRKRCTGAEIERSEGRRQGPRKITLSVGAEVSVRRQEGRRQGEPLETALAGFDGVQGLRSDWPLGSRLPEQAAARRRRATCEVSEAADGTLCTHLHGRRW